MIKSSFRTPGADRLPVGIQVAMVRQRWPPIPPTAVDLSIVIGCVSRPATGPQAPGKRRWRRRLKNDPATPDSKFPTPISCTRRALRKGFCRSPTVNHATDNTRQTRSQYALEQPKHTGGDGGQGRDRTGDLPLFRWTCCRRRIVWAGHAWPF